MCFKMYFDMMFVKYLDKLYQYSLLIIKKNAIRKLTKSFYHESLSISYSQLQPKSLNSQ